MSKTCKKLLASALAATMLISTFVSSLVVSAADVGTLTIGTTEITQGTTEAEVTLTYSYDSDVAAPHNLITFDSPFALSAIELVSVNEKAVEDYGKNVDDLGVILDKCPVQLDEDELTANLEAGKVLLETFVDENNLVFEIVLTATFTVPADKEVGKYDITATSDYAGFAETEGETVAVEAGAIIVNAKVVHSAVAEWSYNETHHWHACSVADCAEHIGETAYDYAEHSYVDGICECGVEEPVTGPVIGEIPVTWNPSAYASLSNLVSLQNYSYQITYMINTTYFNSIKNINDVTLQMVVTGTDLEFTKVIDLYQANTLYFGQCSVGRLNADLNWQLVITYTDSNGIEHIDYTSNYTSNFMERLIELYDKGTYTGDELALVEEFFAFNEVWENASFSNLPLTGYVAGDFAADETKWNLSAYKDYFYTNFSNFHQQVVYMLPNALYNTLNTNKDTLKFKMIISGDTTNFSKDIPLAQVNWLYFRNVSLKKMMEDLTWKLTYEYVDSSGNTQTGETNSITINMANEIAKSSDPVAVAFSEYVEAWNTVYNK